MLQSGPFAIGEFAEAAKEGALAHVAQLSEQNLRLSDWKDRHMEKARNAHPTRTVNAGCFLRTDCLICFRLGSLLSVSGT